MLYSAIAFVLDALKSSMVMRNGIKIRTGKEPVSSRQAAKAVAAGVLVLYSMIFLMAHTADCAERVYYSIHFATFKNLKDVNNQVNSLKEKGRMVFWEKTEREGMGQVYRVYLGKYKSWDEAKVFFDKLRSAGVSRHLGIHWFSEPVEQKGEPGILEPRIPEKLTDAEKGLSKWNKNRFRDNGDGTVTDTRTKLMWIQNGWRLDLISAINWPDAMARCKNFSHGKYTDWRLPTLEEWGSIIDPNNKNPALVQPNPFVNIISHMPYWTKNEFTYGKDRTCINQCPIESYTVMLYSGNFHHQNKGKRAFVLPVRSTE